MGVLFLVKTLSIPHENNTYCRFLHTEMQHYNIIDNKQRQQFQLPIEDELAFLEYRLKDDMIVLMHTEVPERLGGRGIGTALVVAASDDAQAHNLQVKVYCPFVKKYLDRHPELMPLVVLPS